MGMKTTYLKSAVLAKDFPDANRLEVAIAGRSNAGKSSFINTLTTSSIAKVSQEPGKTRLLNFFDVGDNYRLVDMPGYGFAARAGDEVLEWRKMIETYLSIRGNFMGLILIMDARREWEEDEEMLKHFMNTIDKPMLVVLTKIDKMTKNEIHAAVAKIKKASQLIDVFPVSNLKKVGVEEVEEHFFVNWIKPHLKKGKK
jgi:GTP-binding protein